jgi:serine/threonine-protein kinase
MPFVASTPERAMAARMIEAPRSLAAAVPEEAWPPALQDVFDRALDRDPATRTATAMEFGEALVAAVEAWTGEQVLRSRTPLSTRGVTPSSAMQLTAESPRPGVTMEAPRAATPAATPAAVGATESAPPRKASRVPLLLAGVLVVGVAGYFAVMSGRPEAGAGGEAPGAVPVATGDTVRGDSAVGTPAGPATTSQRRAPAAPASGVTVVAPPVAPPPARDPDAASSAVTPRGAITSLDSIQNVLRDDASGEDEARAAIPVLDRLLREMANATDSTWTYLALANAHGQAGSPSTRACNALRSADRLATTVRQRTVVASLFESPAFSCVR